MDITLNCPEAVWAMYEEYFFREICLLDTEGRDKFDTSLELMPGYRFACVQDTVERLLDLTHRGSKFQWRNCVFVAVPRDAQVKVMYQAVFDKLRKKYPSLFIRSYVYVVFVRMDPNEQGQIFKSHHEPSKDDFRIYQWNTNREIRRRGKTDLFDLGSAKPQDRGVAAAQKVFIVENPAFELKRICDANSDVINAVEAYLEKAPLFDQTEDALRSIRQALDSSSDARVLLDGPARSGKTIIAMALLAAYPDARMVLMNWYFYDALKEAFSIWSDMSADDIRRLFETDPVVGKKIGELESERRSILLFQQDLKLLEALIRMRSWSHEDINKKRLPRWFKGKWGSGKKDSWYVSPVIRSGPGDYIVVYSAKNQRLDVKKVEEVDRERRAATVVDVFFGASLERHARYLGAGKDGSSRVADERNATELQALRKTEALLEDKEATSARIAQLVKQLSEELSNNPQRFYHHDRRQTGCMWSEGIRIVPDNTLLVFDEAQRLGTYAKFDEVKWLAERPGRLFMCGDDLQRLNPRGDNGLRKILNPGQDCGRMASFQMAKLFESVGIPNDVLQFVLCLLDEAELPQVTSDYDIKLVFKDDCALVRAFEADGSAKKHYAIPANVGFYDKNYIPCIMRPEIRPGCSASCDDYCRHKTIRMISNTSDPEWCKRSRDLSMEYKFFCAEAIMPNYALSAYELISREVESLFLKIPSGIRLSDMRASAYEDEFPASWKKRHLYVLMTRATSRLVINIEDRGLYDDFRAKCLQAGFCPDLTPSQCA